MRAWLLACAALALAHAAAQPPHPLSHPRAHPTHPRLDPARLDHIKTQILAKLGLSARPRPVGAPPRDVVRQILARAADPPPAPAPHTGHTDPAAMREIIAIAHRARLCNENIWAGANCQRRSDENLGSRHANITA